MVGTRSSTRPNPSETRRSPPPIPAKRGRTRPNVKKGTSKLAAAEKDAPDVDMQDMSAGEAPATVKDSGTSVS